MKHIKLYEAKDKNDLTRSKYETWEKNGEWKRAFEISKKRGSCKIPGDSFINVFRKFRLESIIKLPYIYLGDLYLYEGDLYSISPESHGPDSGYGDHIVKLVDKSKIVDGVSNFLTLLNK